MTFKTKQNINDKIFNLFLSVVLFEHFCYVFKLSTENMTKTSILEKKLYFFPKCFRKKEAL